MTKATLLTVMNVPRTGWFVLALGALALVIGPFHGETERVQRLAAIAGDAPFGDNTFALDGVYSTTSRAEVPPGISTRGSWLGTDEFQGRYESGWFRATPTIGIMLAGYPTSLGNKLELDVRHRNNVRSQIPFTDPNPGETWRRWEVVLPTDAEAVRILGVDATTSAGGWLGFSEPFSSQPVPAIQLWNVLQVFTSTCLAITLICGPGVLWFGARTRPAWALAFAILPGPLLIAALGLLCWVLGGVIAPALIARIGVAGVLVVIAWNAWQRRSGGDFPREINVILAVTALLAGFAAAKANVSFGPAGELYGGSVSRTLAVGNHSDSRISYHVVQLIANHRAPFGSDAQGYFSPWQFASRGPLAGFIAAPIVLSTGARVPRAMPDQIWRPFDSEGFAVYRIALIVLASLAGWAVFATVSGITSIEWGLLAAVLAMLSPFFVHEMYFTWPKLITAACVLVAFLATHRRQAFVAGLMLGLGYLFHPLALFSAPFLGLWLIARPGEFWPRLGDAAWFAAGLLSLVGAWQLVSAFNSSGTGHQAGFLHYFQIADNKGATWPAWWQSRWDNFANTFLPGYLLTGDPKHESVNSHYGLSSSWVRASFLYWNTLPFALGVPGFLLTSAGLVQAFRRATAITFVCVIGPALLLITYWGAASTGLMRHCGHVLFLSVITLGTFGLAQWEGTWRDRAVAAFLHPACFTWRAVEIALVAFGTTLLHQRPRLEGPFGWNDLVSIALAGGCLAGVAILLAKTARSIRLRLFSSRPTSIS